MSRVGLGRRGGVDSDTGDPLDGLVNLFDLGLVLAVAFLVAGLGLATDTDGRVVRRPTTPAPAPGSTERTLSTPSTPSRVTGRGEPVGRVYRLPDGRLVLVDPAGP
ncbi:DUF2149 domain-containing protein [Patulibacter sp.]|uniref:DUF2149 domain-containing protein n=1 Tax=Patulibacter sp. TaxID=1912859 RepID=UPI00271AEE7C|nr:DUF2149 domain-containing protein [Patulibacter sp.]MDO9409030.1 DUF2149 domain-containing protein [Patulibacter sp.]